MLNGGRDRQAKFGQSPLSPHRLQTPLAGQKANIALAFHGSRHAVGHGTRMPPSSASSGLEITDSVAPTRRASPSRKRPER